MTNVNNQKSIPIINDNIEIKLDTTLSNLPRQIQKYHTINKYLTSTLSQSILKGDSMNDISILSESLSGQQIDTILSKNVSFYQNRPDIEILDQTQYTLGVDSEAPPELPMLQSSNISWSLYKTEAEIIYNYYWSPKTDYIINIKSTNDLDEKQNWEYRVAVEVKRIPYIPHHHEITEKRVYSILNRANYASIHSNKNVEPEDKWSFQILHIITDSDQTEQHVNSWFKNQKQTGFSLVILTLITGDGDLIL